MLRVARAEGEHSVKTVTRQWNTVTDLYATGNVENQCDHMLSTKLFTVN